LPFPLIPFLIGAGVSAAASAGSAIANGVSSANAAGAQERSAREAMEMQRRIYEQQRADQMAMYGQQRMDSAPWMEAGRGSLAELLRQMQAGDFDQRFDASQLQNDPGYQFRLAQGQRALERSAAARGGLNSGAFMKSLGAYSQGLASDEFQNAWARNQTENTGRYNRLAGMAGVGQTAAQNLGAFGGQTANALGQYGAQHGNQMGNYYGAVGGAQSAGAIGAGNAFSGGMSSLGNMATMAGMYGSYGGGMGIPEQNAYGGYGTVGSLGGPLR
jgi:hypothetical protein